MKKIVILILAIVLTGCAEQPIEEPVLGDVQPDEIYDNNLIIAGEGGVSGAMFIKAAHTFQEQNGGDIYEVFSGDDFIAAVRDFLTKHEGIGHLEYFGHGNHVGLYVNQAPGVNGGLYVNDVDNNTDYISASIYELPPDIFGLHGWIKFNGCNVADGFPMEDTFAQRTADYFDVDVVAPTGPTEFSSSPNTVNPIPNSNFLDPSFDGDVYMVPTYGDEGFVVVKPNEKVKDGFHDVREGHSFKEAAYGVVVAGLDLGWGENNLFEPHRNITFADAVAFCKAAFGEAANCYVEGYDGHEDTWGIRNLKALQMLVDAKGVDLKWTNPWYNSYVWYGNQNELLTDDFINKKWYTRAEMAILTWNFMSMEE
jgi:hypothetical protein